ncbi:MAG: hypothetical protein DRR19_07270 [Candidatus Parabeggiatoa sp. nov. 1]|nr:MAG: hypothetical protein DRR19_07270 [Gammaproteobacteria bacterium]
MLKKTISRLILMSAAIWGGIATETAFSTNAKQWGNAYPNSNLLALSINLRGACVKKSRKRWKKTWSSGGKVHITAMGALVDTRYPAVIPNNELVVGVRIIPYIVSKKQGKKLFLIPEQLIEKNDFNEFYPTYLWKANALVRHNSNNLKYYPLVLLKVNSEKERKSLEKHLKKQKWQLGILTYPIKATSVKTVGELLEKVFSQKRAKFLEGLPFDVVVELIHERGNTIRFEVKNVEKPSVEKSYVDVKNVVDKSTSLTAHFCSPPKISLPQSQQLEIGKSCQDDKDKIDKLKEERNNLKTQLDEADSRIESLEQQRQKQAVLLEKGKTDCEAQLNEANSRLAEECSDKNRQLTNELADAKRLVQSHLEVVEKLKKKVELLQRQLNGQPSGNHRLIVLSLTRNLRSKEKVIRETLIKVFSNWKTSETKTPFTLLTIQTGIRLNYPLTSDELPRLPIEGEEKSIKGKVERGLRFAKHNLRALDDLKLVDKIIRERKGEAIGSVLYLTDNAGISSKKRNIPSQQRGVPLAWRKDGIRLKVLTTEKEKKGEEIAGCQLWEYAGVAEKQCTYWQENSDTLKKELEVFLGITK